MAMISGPEYRSLMATRRWLVVILTCLGATLASIIALYLGDAIRPLERLMLAAAVLLIAIGTAFSRRSGMLRLNWAGSLVIACIPLLAPTGSPEWLPLPNAVSYCGFVAIVLSPRWLGLAAVFLSPVMLILIAQKAPTNVVAGPLALAGGWILVIQILIGGLALWWAWNSLVAASQIADKDFQEKELMTARSLARQERAILWRRTATRVHESLLNTLRYALSASEIDRSRLVAEFPADLQAPESVGRSRDRRVPALTAAVLDDPVATSVMRVPGRTPTLEITSRGFDAARDAMVELIHNAVRHGGATDVVVAYEELPDRSLLIRVTDNGAGLTATTVPGIGLSTVLDQELTSAFGTWAIRPASTGGVEATLTVPTARSTGGDLSDQAATPFDPGRVLVTSVLAGSCVAGLLYFPALASLGSSRNLLVAAVGIVAVAAAVAVMVRRRRIPAVVGLVLVVPAAAVPWLLKGQPYPCDLGPYVAAVTTMAGFALLVVSAWSRRWSGMLGLPVWAVGSFTVVVSFPSGCREAPSIALINGLLVLPIVIAVAYVGVRAHQRAQRRTRKARERELVERTRAEAAADLNQHLYGAVHQAMEALAQLAGGAAFDEEMHRTLELADARIRAAIQVDPVASGAFALLAKDLVDDMIRRGVLVQVRAVSSSHDLRPVPSSVTALLRRAVASDHPRTATLRAFSDGTNDHLSLTMTCREAAPLMTSRDEGGERDWIFADVTVERLEVGADGPGLRDVTFIVSRPVHEHLSSGVEVSGAT